MMPVDWNSVVALMLAAALGGLLLGVALIWRRFLREAPSLPVWRFVRRIGLTRGDAEEAAGAQALKDAELRCALCAGRPQCVKRLAAGGRGVPLEHCPNARPGGTGLPCCSRRLTKTRRSAGPSPALSVDIGQEQLAIHTAVA